MNLGRGIEAVVFVGCCVFVNLMLSIVAGWDETSGLVGAMLGFAFWVGVRLPKS